MVLNKSKTNPELGKKVNDFLEIMGVQTPMNFKKSNLDEKKIDIIGKAFSDIMIALNLDLKDDSLQETPLRIGKMFVNDLFWGLKNDNFPKCTTVKNKANYKGIVSVCNIKVASVCEHHFVTIWGNAHVAYIPNKKILGLSKINRIVEYFSRRPQIQERLIEQIYFALKYILDTDNIAIIINGEHFCVKQRGVEDVNSYTVTDHFGGIFEKDSSYRDSFFKAIEENKKRR